MIRSFSFRFHRPFHPLLAGVSLFAAVSAQQGGDHPALGGNTISLPSGPGSIEGLGESFEPQLNTGSYVFRLPFKLPPVRGKAQPEVSMVYNSGNGNGPLGLGWNLRVPHVQRQTDKGLPSYDDEEDRFITGDGEELTARADGSYRRKVETDFTKWENLGTDGWKGLKRDGTVMRFGATVQARQERAPGQVFRWMLEACEDTNGNRVEYAYQKHEGQIYLAEIRYGLHATEESAHFRVAFDYDEGRPDALADYRGRFKAVTALRLRRVTAFLGERRVRHWRLDYHENRPLTQLARFTVFGDERTETGAGAELNEDYLPPVEFAYAESKLGEAHQFFSAQPAYNISLADGNNQFGDLNGDGLVDLIMYFGGTYYSLKNNGQGRNWTPATFEDTSMYYPPLGDARVRIADFRGDGRLAVLAGQGAQPYFREFLDEKTLGPPVLFNVPDQFSLTDPAVRTVDITNTRALDFMVKAGSTFHFIINNHKDGPNEFYAAPESEASLNAGGSNRWQVVDLNGDRMPDIGIMATQEMGGVQFYPGKGKGEFDPVVVMSGGPSLTDLGGRGMEGLTFADLDGDGLPELVMVDFGVVKIWPNRSGIAFGEPVVISGPDVPGFYQGGTTVQFLDMNGNGSTDIVWNDPARGIFLKYLELHPGTKPNVMTRMRNGMGRELEIEYRSSVDYMIEAEIAGEPWTAKPPFPIPVVSAFTERDGFGSTYRTELTYRNGYYDGPEREFRGFERAIQMEVGNDAQGAPSLVSEFRFDTGATVEARKGLVLSSELRTADGHVFHRVETDWNHRALPGNPAAGETRPVVFAYQESETTTVIEGGAEAPVTLLKEFDFDDYGNPILLADYGRVEGENRGAWQDERITKRTFSAAWPANVTKWMLDYPVTERIEAMDGSPAAETRYFYDDPSFSGGNTGVLIRGNATLVRKLVDPTSGRFLNAERKAFDAFGNPTHLLDPLGTAPGAPHSRTIAYDGTLHTHPVSETIHIGEAVASVTLAADYDFGLGVLTESQDFNGHRTFYAYDPFGRISSIAKPGDSAGAPTESYDYRLGIGISGGRTINWIETRDATPTALRAAALFSELK